MLVIVFESPWVGRYAKEEAFTRSESVVILEKVLSAAGGDAGTAAFGNEFSSVRYCSSKK
jgi:hypothetical protein